MYSGLEKTPLDIEYRMAIPEGENPDMDGAMAKVKRGKFFIFILAINFFVLVKKFHFRDFLREKTE